jgi:hypothetical protein
MPYVFPKDRIRPNTPMDHEEINGNFQSLIGAATGALNEHNFSSDALDVAPDVASVDPFCVWHVVDTYCDPAPNVGVLAETGGTSLGKGRDYLTENPTLHSPRSQGVWEVIGGLTQTIASTGGAFWILSSFQHDGRTKVGLESAEVFISVSGTPGVLRKFWSHYGALYAIRVNGQIIHETVTGGVFNNSVVSRGDIEHGKSGHLNVTITCTGEKVCDTYGIHGDTGLFPVSLDFVVDLPAGTHTIDIVMQVIPHPVPGDVSVSNREMVILEMRH